jgi:hypothetical protein
MKHNPYIYFMNRNKILHFLFSKAVILTYIFIGYLSLINYDSPTCSVDSVPQCSTNDLAYPSVQTFHISMTEHIRSFKPVSTNHSFELAIVNDWAVKPIAGVLLFIAKSPLISLPYFYDHSSRAPPSFIL